MPDDLETLLKDIAYADRIPHAALRAAMGHAAALAPRVEALARRCIAGEWLCPSEEYLLFYGLFVLAAAKERAIWPVWLDLLELPQEHVEALLADDAIQSVAAVTLGLVDEDVPAIVALIENPETADSVRCGLVNALARLMCEERYPRAAFVDIVDRLAAVERNEVLWAVESAILYGGLGERADLLEQIWRIDAFKDLRDIDRIGARKELKAAAANPGDMTRFDKWGIAAPCEPTDGMRWLNRIDRDRAPDPPEATPLSWRERQRLAELLEATTPAGRAMKFEEIDGYFHALVYGPECVPETESFPRIWGAEDSSSLEAAAPDEAIRLLNRHLGGVSLRLLDGVPPRPWLDAHDGFLPGQIWGRGFLAGVALRPDPWSLLPEDSHADAVYADIEMLDDRTLEPDTRIEILENLPHSLRELEEHWRAGRQPIRVQKIGRNEPCPCGSGKKWKKCCGAAGD